MCVEYIFCQMNFRLKNISKLYIRTKISMRTYSLKSISKRKFLSKWKVKKMKLIIILSIIAIAATAVHCAPSNTSSVPSAPAAVVPATDPIPAANDPPQPNLQCYYYPRYPSYNYYNSYYPYYRYWIIKHATCLNWIE